MNNRVHICHLAHRLKQQTVLSEPRFGFNYFYYKVHLNLKTLTCSTSTLEEAPLYLTASYITFLEKV